MPIASLKDILPTKGGSAAAWFGDIDYYFDYATFHRNQGTICPETGDSYEPDNSSSQANWISSGSPQSHSIIPADDQDWVKFTLSAESAVTLESSGASGDTQMWLYNSSLTEIEYDDDDGTSTFPSCAPFALNGFEIEDDGSWLEVSLVDPNAPVGGNQLEIQLTKADSDVSYMLLRQGRAADEANLGSALGINAFDGVSAEGAWQLRVRDMVPGGQGRLTVASVRAHYTSLGPPPDIIAGTLGRATSLSIPAGAVKSNVADSEDKKQATSASPDQVGWQTIKSETFEGSFPASDWIILDISNDGCELLWDDDHFRPHNGGRAGWAADGGADGLDPATSNYPPNMNSWMIYGPFDLSQASEAETLFWMWREIEANYDKLFFGISSDADGWHQHDQLRHLTRRGCQ